MSDGVQRRAGGTWCDACCGEHGPGGVEVYRALADAESGLSARESAQAAQECEVEGDVVAGDGDWAARVEVGCDELFDCAHGIVRRQSGDAVCAWIDAVDGQSGWVGLGWVEHGDLDAAQWTLLGVQDDNAHGEDGVPVGV